MRHRESWAYKKKKQDIDPETGEPIEEGEYIVDGGDDVNEFDIVDPSLNGLI